MKIPRWLLIAMSALVVTTMLATGFTLWRSRPGADLSGFWEGTGWGSVHLQRSDDGGFEGTYTSTFGRHTGQIRLDWLPQSREYRGTWSEGTYRFGTLTIRGQDDNGVFHGTYSADSKSEYLPGEPKDSPFEWNRSGATGSLTRVRM